MDEIEVKTESYDEIANHTTPEAGGGASAERGNASLTIPPEITTTPEVKQDTEEKWDYVFWSKACWR